MTTELFGGRITQFRREQGFGVITLDDGRVVKFDSAICTMLPEEGGVVRVRVAPAKWGGGEKAVHVEPVEAADSFLAAKPKLSLENQLAAVQGEHLVAQLTESVMAAIVADVFGGKLDDATLLDVLDAYYTADPVRAKHDGYLRHDWRFHQETDDVLAELAVLLPDVKLPAQLAWTERDTTERGHRELRASLRVRLPDGAEQQVDIDSLDDVVELVNKALRTAGDGRRVYALDTAGDWHAYYVLASDRAKRLAGMLPFATDPKTMS
jgi:cold shock CspA family protein